MREILDLKGPIVQGFPSPELPPSAAKASDPWLKRKLSSRAAIPPKDPLPLELGNEKSVFEILGLYCCFRSIGIVRLEIVVCAS